MSKTVDERVVSMQFDNKHFESNVKNSMSTLDKLKQKLHLKGAEKGLNNVNKASKNVDMSHLSNGVETVRARFSALDVIAVTALANITNAAVNTGLKMVKALTIDPVMDGFREYEMTMNAVQTTMSATGKTAEEVESELKKLDEYADKTVYSTADMLNNLPKFTNAGIDLETSTQAMIGIANATAHAGGDAAKASIAFYNLGQAMSTGYLTRMDYNSINNAGIATMKWKEQMVDAAVAAGTLKKAGNDAYVAGGKTFTLQQLFIEGLQEQWASTDVMMKVFGDYADSQTEIGKAAWESATKVKTFSMMMDTLKATAGTGWKETWQILFGGLEDASKMWTGLTNFISNIITKIDDYRNTILDKALNKNPFAKLLDKVEKFSEKTNKAVQSVKDLGDIVDRVIRGDFGNQWDNGDRNFRAQLVEKEGFEYAAVQNAVNEKLGSSVRLKTKATEAQKELNKETSRGIDDLLKLSDAELKKLGFDAEEIKMLRALEREAKRTGKSVSQLTEEMSAEPSGRELLMEAFSNMGKGLKSVLESIGKAWKEVFPPESMALKLYNTIKGFRDLSKSFVMTADTADKLKRTFKGVFATISIISKIIAGPIKIAFKLLMAILKAFDVDILGVTANIGDVIVKFNEWLDAIIDFDAVASALVAPIKAIASAIKKFFNAIKNSKAFTYFVDGLKKMGSGLSEWFKGLKEADNIPMYIIKGLANGLKNGATLVFKTIGYIAEGLVNTVKKLLGIHSPSVVFMVIGGFIISGLVKGLMTAFPELDGALGGIFTKITEVLGGIDWTGLFAGGSLTALLSMGYKWTDALTAPLRGVGDVLQESAEPIGKTLEGVALVVKNSAKVVKSFGKVLSAKAFKTRTEGIKDLAVALLLLVGAVAILTFFEPKKLWKSVAVVTALAGILAAMAWAIGELSDSSLSFNKKDGLQIRSTMSNILGIALSLLIVAFAAKLVAGIDNLGKAFVGMLLLVGSILGILWAYGKFVNGKAAKNIDKLGKTIRKIGTAMLILAIVAKILGGMDAGDLAKGLFVITYFSGIIVGLIAASKLAGKRLEAVGKMIRNISVAMLLMAIVAKIVAGMDPDEMSKAFTAITVFAAIITGLIAATKLAGKDIDNIGRTILAISAAMLVLTIVAKILGGMEWSAMTKAAVGLLSLTAIVGLLIICVKILGNDAPKIAATILAMSIAIGALALVATLIGMVDTVQLAKGIIAIGLLSLMMSMMVLATKNANDPWKSILAMVGGIAVLAIALGILSLCDPVKLLAAAASMGVVMAAFALMMSQLKKIKIQDKSVYIQLGLLVGVVAIIAGILYLLRDIPAQQSLGTALSISAVIIALSGCLVALNKVGGMSSKALMGVVGLLALCVPLLALVGILYLMQDIKNAGDNALILAGFITVLTLCMIPLTLVGTLAVSALLGVAGVLALCVSLLAIVGVLALMQGVENAEKNALLLERMLVVMTAVLVVLAIVGPLALIGVAAITALSGLMVVMAVLATAVGGLMELCPSLERFIDTGIRVFIKLAGGIGEMIGAFVGGIAAGLTARLPEIGKSLSDFMTNAQPFIDGIKNVDSSTSAAVGFLVSAIIALAAASFIEAILSFLSFGSDFSDLGTKLSEFMINAQPFIDNASKITPHLALSMKYLSDAILSLTAGNLLNSITDWLFGSDESTMTTFGKQIGGLGTSLKTFVDNIGTFDDAQVKTVKCACDAIKALAAANESLPSTGGWWQAIAGEQMDLTTFSSKFPAVATYIKEFITNLGTFGDDQVKTAKCGADVVAAIAQATSELPDTGGWWQAIAGEQMDIGAFSAKFPAVAKGVKGFVDTLGTFGDDQLKTAKCGAEVVAAIATATTGLPNTGGWWQAIAGEQMDVGTFASKFPKVAEGINGFISKLKNVNDDSITTVNAAIECIKAIASVTSSMEDMDEDDAEDMTLALSKFVGGITGVIKVFIKTPAETFDTAKQRIATLKELIEGIKGIDTEALTKFNESLSKAGTDGLSKFLTALTGEDSTAKIKEAAAKVISTFAGAVSSEVSTTDNKAKFASAAKSAVSNLDSKEIKDLAADAGKHVVTGFANGIKNNKKLATDAGSSLGKAALKAAKEALDENSPSKEMYKVGDFAGIGFVNGLNEYTDKAARSGYEMGDSAKTGLSRAIAKISNLVDLDIDSQPTIRPVLDLSDVRSGAGMISGMLGNRRTISVDGSFAGSIASSMRTNQNGGDSEIVSALGELRKDIANMPRNSYSVGNVTYDDGSGIANAVEALVRAARVERRS